jgi:Arc/MetJ-type ribon-helix-helix transcriptional regulator
MPTVEVTLPKELDAQLDYLVEDGEFVSRDEAVADLISMALTTYEEDSAPDPVGEDLFLQTLADQQDPAARQEPRGGWG